MNKIIKLSDGSISIEMTQGKSAIVDAKDYPLVCSYRWRPMKSHSTFYAISSPSRDGVIKTIRISRLILGIENPKIQVDHKDNDGLNNRRNNLRPCTLNQNNANRRAWGKVGFRGVQFNGHKWIAIIKVNSKRHYLGSFKDTKNAAKAYNKAATKYFGEFAGLNIVL